MNRDKISKRERRARRTRNVSETHRELDLNYDVSIFSGREITEHGLLEIGELKSKHGLYNIRPSFRFRWHEEYDALDVDVEGASTVCINKFKKDTKNASDYSGHHTVRIGSSPRVFDVNIMWQGKQIYRGHISFNLEFEVIATATVGISASVSYSVNEASRLSKLSPQHIRYLLSKGVLLGKKLGHDWIVLSLDYKRKRKPKGYK